MSKYLIFVSVLMLALVSFIKQADAHAEHDKARYVADSGDDVGRCDDVNAPCKSIFYAVQNANKGDQIRVSKGSYFIENADTLFYLLSDLIPVIPNYQRADLFAVKAQSNLTYLTGVPAEYVQLLSNKGFTVIVDKKAQDNPASVQSVVLARKLQSYAKLQQVQTNSLCIDNLSGDFPCNNIDLLAHLPLNSFSTNPGKANDIWGHYDLNSQKEYAIIGLDNGVSVVDVSNPSAPSVINTIASETTGWRDIKIYQYFDIQLTKWQSYAYVTADNANVGIMILDLNQLPNSVTVAANDSSDISAHNVYLSNVDYSTGVALTGKTPYLHIAGSNFNGGGFNTYSLENPRQLSSVYKPSPIPSNDRQQYSHDISSMVIEDQRKDSQCVNGSDHCEVMFDFNENDFQLWDKTNNAQPEKLSTTSYANASYVHSGWYSEDKMMMLVHDELDEQSKGLNTTLRLFDITNLTAPSLLSTWTGSTRTIDHNGYVRGNRYYMSNYERGLTVLDISDPLLPSEVGFFDTYPISNNASFNGAWGVYPFLPSGNVLVSDINSGLYILKDNTLATAQGSLRFNASQYQGDEGQAVNIEVQRIDENDGQSSDAVAVNWQLVSGSADVEDFTLASGSLNWADGDNNTKNISVNLLSDNLAEGAELLLVRLFDPKNGVTLGQPNLATINISASEGEHVPQVNIGNDFSGNAGQQVNLTATVTDLDDDNLTYLWQQSAGETVEINNANALNANFIAPQRDSELTFTLTVTDSTGLSASDSVNVTIEVEVIVVTPQASSGGGSSQLMLLLAMFFMISYRKVAAKSQKPKAKSQKPKAKSQKPKVLKQ